MARRAFSSWPGWWVGHSHHGAGGMPRKGFGTWHQARLRSALLSSPSSDLQLRLETVTAESQEKMDAQAAAIAKLNKALRGKLEVSWCQKWASAHPRAEPNWDRR